MKKIILIIVAVVLVVSGYALVNRLFPKAPPLQILENGIISVSADGKELTDKEKSDVIEALSKAKPTRRMSVNDTPTVQPYSVIVLTTKDRQYICFVYSEYGREYMEIPYEGIYSLN